MDWITTLVILGAAIALFASQVVRTEITALLIILALAFSRVLTPEEALSGFASQAFVTVAAMFVLSAGLVRSGALCLVTETLVRLGAGSRTRLLACLGLFVAASSAFMNNTPLVGAMMPVALSLARRLGVSPSKLLIPISYFAILGGTCTLVGTSTNILVHALYRQAGGPGFTPFDFTGLGLVYLLVGGAVIVLLSGRLLPDRTPRATTDGGLEAPALKRKAPVSLAIMALVLTLASARVAPLSLLSLAGATAMVLTGCLDTRRAIASLDRSVLFLIAGSIPLGVAVEKTGLAGSVVLWLLDVAGPLGPVAIVSAVYLLTSVLTEFLSNNAVAVLLTPIALGIAAQTGIDPKPLLVAVAFGASASFATPIGYQTNAMVMGPGGYTFGDFARLGLPLNVALWITGTVCIPLFWPL